MLIRDIQPSLIEWDGFLTNIVFTYGCNWRCRYCFQRDLLKQPDRLISEDKVIEKLEYDKDRFGINHIEIIGGEPTIYRDLSDFVKELFNKGFRIMIATNGSNPEVIDDLLSYVDFWAVDYKTTFDKYSDLIRKPFDKNKYLESVRLIHKSNYIIRTTYLKGYHDDLLQQMAKELCEFTDANHYHVQQGLYQNTLDPSFKFEDSTSMEAETFETKIKKEMEAICGKISHKNI